MNINHFQPTVYDKTEYNVTVPSNRISLRTKLKKKKKNVVNIDHFHPKVAPYQS